MRTIFLSYSSVDRDFAWRLSGDFQFTGANVWLDRSEIQRFDDEPNESEESEYVLEKLKDGIGRVDKFLVVLSPAAMQSSWVIIELSLAKQFGLEIICVIHKQTEMINNDFSRNVDFSNQSLYEKSFLKLIEICGLKANLQPYGILSGYWIYEAYKQNFANGIVVLSHRGKNLFGRIDFETGNSGRLSGRVNKNSIEYLWSNSLEKGTGKLNIFENGKTIKGYFVRDGTDIKVPWELKRSRMFKT